MGDAAYYQKNKKEIDKKNAKWRKDNPEAAKVITRRYYYKNRAKRLAEQAEYRKNNKDKILRKSRAYYKKYGNSKNKKRANENKHKCILFLGNICSKCKCRFDDVCYDFHHVNPKVKVKDVCRLLGGKWETILPELKKCILVCSNCHRLIHKKEKEDSYKQLQGKRKKTATSSS